MKAPAAEYEYPIVEPDHDRVRPLGAGCGRKQIRSSPVRFGCAESAGPYAATTGPAQAPLS